MVLSRKHNTPGITRLEDAMEFLFVVAALVAVKHFCRVSPRHFDVDEIREMTVSRSEYRACARKFR